MKKTVAVTKSPTVKLKAPGKSMSHYLTRNQDCESFDCAKSQLLTSFQRKFLLKKLKSDLPAEYQRRIEIMLLADMGKSQTQICQILNCSQEMARYWIAVAEAGAIDKWEKQKIGRPKVINNEYLKSLKELVSHSPREYGYAFKSWTAKWLSKHLAREFGIEISDRHINRLLKKMGLSTKQRQDTQAETNTSPHSGITIGDLKFPSEPSIHSSFNLITR